MKVKLISLTQPIQGDLSPEQLIVYTARVSNPSNQSNTGTSPRLIKYLIDQKHWSPFQMVDMTVEIQTSRSISAQILRHQSADFQEFSQRYSNATEFELPELRYQATDNRQSSKAAMDIVNDETAKQLHGEMYQHIINSFSIYNKMLNHGVAREVARDVLPLCTRTTLYMKNDIRGWIHYLSVRDDQHTQKEHRAVAKEVKRIFKEQFPIISEALKF